MLRLFFYSLFILLAFGCSTPRSVNSNLTEVKKTDASYGSFASSKMDIYLPANRNEQTPFVILIHGGAWTLGGKEWNSEEQDSLLAHGIASANINYRFADNKQVHYPELLADIDTAINYCIDHSAAWNTRKKNFMVSGTSAGGHLSLLYAYTTPKKISAIIANCPPTDLADTAVLNYETQMGLLPVIEKMTGAQYIAGKPLPAAFTSASPLYHVKNIPTLLIHGTGDRTVLYAQSVALEKILASRNIQHKLFSIPGADHDLNLNDRANKARVFKETIDWMLQYGN